MKNPHGSPTSLRASVTSPHLVRSLCWTRAVPVQDLSSLAATAPSLCRISANTSVPGRTSDGRSGRGSRAVPAPIGCPHARGDLQGPGEVRLDEVADPVLASPDEAIIAIEATGVCGSDLHIFHGRVPVDPGTTIGHEYVGTVTAVGDAVPGSRSATGCSAASSSPAAAAPPACAAITTAVSAGGPSATARTSARCGGTQADQALIPFADMRPAQGPGGHVGGDGAVRRRRDGDRLPRDRPRRDAGGRHGRGAGARPGRALRGAGGGRRRRVPGLRGRLGRAAARPGGAVRRHPDPPHRGRPEREVRAATEGRGADVVVEAVGQPEAVDAAIGARPQRRHRLRDRRPGRQARR